MKYDIYILVNPQTNEPRYVGKSVNYLSRYKKDFSEFLNGRTKQAYWIKSLLNKGFLPIIERIRIVDSKYANETEIYCIAEYKRLGCDLTNGTIGGTGGTTRKGHVNTPETRKKISAALKGRPMSEATKEAQRLAHLGKKASQETRNKMSESQKKRTTRSEEQKKKISKTLQGHEVSEETRKQISETVSRTQYLKGHEAGKHSSQPRPKCPTCLENTLQAS